MRRARALGAAGEAEQREERDNGRQGRDKVRQGRDHERQGRDRERGNDPIARHPQHEFRNGFVSPTKRKFHDGA